MLLTRAAEMMYFCWNYFQAMWYGSLWNMVPQLLGPTESTVMVFCAVIGTGTVFFIDVKLSEMVHEVKRLIKKEKPHLINFDSSLLRLYLAREDDAWMDSRDEATMEALKTEPVPERIAALIQQELILFQYKCLNEIACFSSNFQQSNHNIHVLVQLPDEPEKVTQHKSKHCFSLTTIMIF
ncbi:hypothetical protein P3T76_001295 [Phytophthora citrophthora]|uniref:Crinkler effector protein N-terminal domain-containing protein n=1 Tax=Phytophthora citrophthora TaxID=4793 RepID=A0AAD9LRN3_9STRA|nr:hypothetical protein P3T76_001295 [Phytophthora citrophthora]